VAPINQNRMDRAIYLMIHIIIIAMVFLDIFVNLMPRGREYSSVKLIIDVGTISAISVLLVLSAVTRIPLSRMYAVSLLLTSANVLFSISTVSETSLLLDILLLLSISILFSLFVIPAAGVAHGIFSGIFVGIHVFRFSTVFMWSSRNFTILLGILVGITMLVAFFASRYRQMEHRLRRETHQGPGLEQDRGASWSDGLLFRMISPLLLKSAIALAEVENTDRILQEYDDAHGMVQSQRELLMEIQANLRDDLQQLHQNLSLLSQARILAAETGGSQIISPVESARRVLDQEQYQANPGAYDIQLSGDAELRCMINRPGFEALITAIHHYGLANRGKDFEGGLKLQFSSVSKQLLISCESEELCGSAPLAAIRNGLSRSEILERNSELLFIEYICTEILGGQMNFPADGDFCFQLHLPI
jgi:hypothetical protein